MWAQAFQGVMIPFLGTALGSAGVRSGIWTFGVDRASQRGADAAAVFLLGASAAQGQKPSSQMDGSFQPVSSLRDFESGYLADAEGTFRLAFTNGLMSEGMALWFGSMLL